MFRTSSRSKRVPIIAGVLLLIIVAGLLLNRKLGLFHGESGGDAMQANVATGLPKATSAGGGANAAAPAAGKGADGGGKPPPAGAGGGAAGAPPKPPTPVKVARVKQAMMTDDVSAVGTLLAEESVVIRPEIAGRVTKIHFNEGQVVNANAPLVSIDPAELKAQLAQTAADMTLSKQRYDRAQNLFRQNFISRQALDEASSNLQKASAERQEILAKLQKTELRAPFKGVLGLRKISAGAYVRPGEDIVNLEDISAMKLDFRVPEVFLNKVAKDAAVNLRVDAYPQSTFSGRIFAIEPVVDEQTRTVLIRAKIPNTEGKLRPGMFARVALVLEERGTALVIPEQAIVPKGNAALVVKIVDNKAEFTPIKIGRRKPGEVEVVEGLNVDDVIVTDGQIKLQPGSEVKVLEAPPVAGTEQKKG